MFCLHIRMCITSVSDAYGGEKNVLDPLELDLWMVVSRHVDSGN